MLRLVGRHETWGLRVPQFGWLRHRRPGQPEPETFGEPIQNDYARTHRWERLPRDEDAAARGLHISSIATTLFSTALEDLDLYHKPMARNCQIWTRDGELVLDGPTAARADIRARRGPDPRRRRVSLPVPIPTDARRSSRRVLAAAALRVLRAGSCGGPSDQMPT